MLTTVDLQSVAAWREQFGDEGWWLLDRATQGVSCGAKTRALLALSSDHLALTDFLAALKVEDRPEVVTHLDAVFFGSIQ